MLGHHPKVRHELATSGRRALAKLREAKRTHYSESFGTTPAQEVSNTRILWKLLLHVEPEGEPAFDAHVDEFFGADANPEPSERHYQFVVLFDPSDHNRIVIDHSDEAGRMLTVQQFRERTDAQVDRMRQRGQGFWADRVQAAQDSMAEYIGQDRTGMSSDEREDALQAQKEKMREIMAGDSRQRADQLLAIQRDPSLSPDERRTKMAEVMAGMGVSVAKGPAGEPPPAAAVSGPAATADALAKLGDLRDRGLLTDAEFQAQKSKLLGS